MQDKIPDISINGADLDSAGFTSSSGKGQYIKTVEEYSKILFEKSINFGEIDKAQAREVTHDHVKSAAHSIATSYGKPTQPKWLWIIKLLQYIFAIFVGVATNHLENLYGAIGFVSFFALGLICLSIEINTTKS